MKARWRGGALGLPGGALGVCGGAAIGGVLGAAAGFMESMPKKALDADTDAFVKALRANAATAPGGTPVVIQQKAPPITLNLNVDGRALASAVTDVMGNQTGFSTQAPAADGVAQPNSADHNYGSK